MVGSARVFLEMRGWPRVFATTGVAMKHPAHCDETPRQQMDDLDDDSVPSIHCLTADLLSRFI